MEPPLPTGGSTRHLTVRLVGCAPPTCCPSVVSTRWHRDKGARHDQRKSSLTRCIWRLMHLLFGEAERGVYEDDQRQYTSDRNLLLASPCIFRTPHVITWQESRSTGKDHRTGEHVALPSRKLQSTVEVQRITCRCLILPWLQHAAVDTSPLPVPCSRCSCDEIDF